MNIPEQMTSMTADQVLDATQAYREHFGLTIDPRTNPVEFDQAIDEANPRFRGERKHIDVVRFQLENDVTDYTTADKKQIMRTAGALDMLAPETPLLGEYDVIAGLGAARMAPYDRLKYAAKAIRAGQAAGQLIAAGSTRKLAPGEAAAATYAPETAITEEDLLKAAAMMIGEEDNLDVQVIIIDNERAHNSLILDGIANSIPNIRRLAGVTTQIYQVRTSLDFERQGEIRGIRTAVAGNPSDPMVVAKRTPATYQSEIAGAQKAAAKFFIK